METIMEDPQTFTAFLGERLLASGAKLNVALSVKAELRTNVAQTILIFEDGTGRQVDFDLRGEDHEIAARLATEADDDGRAKRSGRPKLGVVSREVTLLPRHWDWLADQPGGASVTLRKLVDAARRTEGPDAVVRQAKQVADRFMSTMLGNQPGYEEASRALYGADRRRFMTLTEAWPADLRDHARRLAAAAFPEDA
jgi:hypothetical protein